MRPLVCILAIILGASASHAEPVYNASKDAAGLYCVVGQTIRIAGHVSYDLGLTKGSLVVDGNVVGSKDCDDAIEDNYSFEWTPSTPGSPFMTVIYVRSNGVRSTVDKPNIIVLPKAPINVALNGTNATIQPDASSTFQAQRYEAYCDQTQLGISSDLVIKLPTPESTTRLLRIEAYTGDDGRYEYLTGLKSGPGGYSLCDPPGPSTNKAAVSNVKVNPIDGAEMVYVPSGEFQENPISAVLVGNTAQTLPKTYLDAYWIYKFPVTVAQFRRFCKATNRDMPLPPSWGWRDDNPMVNVTYADAVAYAEWAGVGIPSRDEWLKAAYGLSWRKYPWGNDYDDAKICYSRQTCAVGLSPMGASPCGAQDMVSNVGQWLKSEHIPNPDTDEYYVAGSGGTSGDPSTSYQIAIHGNIVPTAFDPHVGFRCIDHDD